MNVSIPCAAPAAAALGLAAVTLSASAGSINLNRATTGAASDTAPGFLQSQLDARDSDPGFASAFLADDVDLALPGGGGVNIRSAGDSGAAGSNIDARVIDDQRIDVSGTSRRQGTGADTLHSVVFDIVSNGGTFTIQLHDADPVTGAFDRALLSSLEIFDEAGNAVAFANPAASDPSGLPAVTVALPSGNFTARLSADGDAALEDDHFAFSAVAAAPSPTAVAAGLLGLVALAGRRRRA